MAEPVLATPSSVEGYEGPYSVVFDPEFRQSIPLPESGTVDESAHMLTVPQGSLEKRRAGFQFSSAGEKFFWPFRRIMEIRNGANVVIWKNENPGLG